MTRHKIVVRFFISTLTLLLRNSHGSYMGVKKKDKMLKTSKWNKAACERDEPGVEVEGKGEGMTMSA